MLIGRPQSEIIERSREIRNDFNRRHDKERLREELYEAQSHLCFLCKKDLQSSESVICDIEHAIPVRLYAEFDYPIETSCFYANGLANLFLAHVSCNHRKGSIDADEWFEDERADLVKLPELPEQVVTRLRAEQSERSRRGGLAGGRTGGLKSAITNMKNKTAIFAPGMQAKGGRTSGHVQRKKKELQFLLPASAQGVAEKLSKEGTGYLHPSISVKVAAEMPRPGIARVSRYWVV